MCWKNFGKKPEPQKIVINQPQTKTVLDPRGMIRTDIAFIKQYIGEVHWKEGISLEDVAYAQGQHDLLKFIETKVVGRRLDSGSITPQTTRRSAKERTAKGLRQREESAKRYADGTSTA